MCNKTNLIQKVPGTRYRGTGKEELSFNQPTGGPKNGKNRSVAEQFGSIFFVK